MQKNTVTDITSLVPGDRFYKAADAKKEVWEVVEHDGKKTKFQTYNYFAKRDQDRYPSAINRNTQLVFLRHKA